MQHKTDESSVTRVRGDHSPRIDSDRSRVLGCVCGWRVPHGDADSDDSFALHAALHAAMTVHP